GQDREAIWQGQTHVGDGSRHSDRGSVGRDAKFRNADPLSGWLAARTAHATREGVSDQAVGGRARERAGQTDRTRGRDICSRSQPRPARQGAIDASAPVEKTDQASARTATTRPDARRTMALLQRCWRVGILREFGAKGFRFSCWERIIHLKLHSKARRHIPRQRHRVTNWREYDASLRNRGSLTIWFTPEAIAGWKAQPRTTPGGQRHYSDLAIETALTLRTVFRLALRQSEGLIG